MKKLKILYGVCGLGNGHTYRQLPIIEYFSKTSEMIIFAHDNSYDLYASKFQNHPSVKVVQVAIPFYAGNKDGIDFQASVGLPINRKEIFQINCAALDRASKELGTPDLVITDYESVSAQYAYAKNVSLVTIDQQSKYLYGDFPEEIAGFTFKDEIERLHMFFPKAAARIACSFFNVPLRSGGDEVRIFPPTLKDAVVATKRSPRKNVVLVYISSAREFGQTPEEVTQICSGQENVEFHIFLPEEEFSSYEKSTRAGIMFYAHGDPMFDRIMESCAGIISTAGHSLLSEAMYLNIPVYAIPVSPYEQHMNARIIAEHSFGISHQNLDVEKLKYFIENLPQFTNAIQSDREVLLRGIGQEKIIEFLEKEILHH